MSKEFAFTVHNIINFGKQRLNSKANFFLPNLKFFL